MRIKLHNRTIDTNGDYRVYNLQEFDTIVNKGLEARLKPTSRRDKFLFLNTVLMAELGTDSSLGMKKKYQSASKKLMGYIDKEVGTNFKFFSD